VTEKNQVHSLTSLTICALFLRILYTQLELRDSLCLGRALHICAK